MLVMYSMKLFLHSKNMHSLMIIGFYEKVPKNIIWNTDIDYLNTIIINLLSNAFKYTFEKEQLKLDWMKSKILSKLKFQIQEKVSRKKTYKKFLISILYLNLLKMRHHQKSGQEMVLGWPHQAVW